ncbi:MAG: inositol monophosphatase family protein [Prevotella sp.]
MIQISTLTEVVRQASALMVVDGFEIEQKGGCENIVTTSDLAVQGFLCGRLAELLPGCGFLCEEKDICDVQHEYTWIIDPIDGTANYSRGIDQCAICVGLKHADDMVMGVVYLPRTDEMFYAEKGRGAYLNGRRIHVSDRSFGNGVMCTALPVYHKEYAGLCSEIIVETFGRCNDIRRFGACAPELCYLAMGRCELYFEYLLSPWDFAAASLIVAEAGGVISSLDGHRLSLVSPGGVIAANSRCNHDVLLEIVSRVLERNKL